MGHSAKLTQHAGERSRERLGLKPESVLRMAEMALTRGVTPHETSGALHRWLKFKQAAHARTELRIYGEIVFVFGTGNSVVTLWPLPREFKATMTKIRDAKRVPEKGGE